MQQGRRDWKCRKLQYGSSDTGGHLLCGASLLNFRRSLCSLMEEHKKNLTSTASNHQALLCLTFAVEHQSRGTERKELSFPREQQPSDTSW